MPEGVTPPDPGLISSVADEISLPGYAVRNLFRGDIGAAGRNIADFALNFIDAPLPGDWIPEISGPKDRPGIQDVVGPIDDGFVGGAIELTGNILTDPLTYVPGAAVVKGAAKLGQGVKAVTPKVVQEGVAKVAKPVGKTIRKTFGAEKIGKPLANVITAAQGAKETTARAGSDAIVEGLRGASQRELEAAGEVLLNVTKDKQTGALRAIDETDTLSVQDRLASYLADNPDVNPDTLARIVSTAGSIGKSQWESGKAGNIFTDIPGQPSSDVVMGAVPGTTGSGGVREYFPRVFKNEDEAAAFENMAQPSAIQGRKFETTKGVLEHLAAHPELQLITNAAEVLSKRASQQAELAARGATGQGLLDLARQSDIALPDELLAKALPLYQASIPRAVVTEGGGDVSRMLGGDVVRGDADLLAARGWQSGKSVVPETGFIPENPPDPYGIGQFSGTAKPPVSAVDDAPRSPLDIYGIGSQSGKAKPPATSAIEDASESSLAAYGVGTFSGKAKPPVTGPIDERIIDQYGIGSQSGRAKPPATGQIDPRAPDPYGVGTQSGKALPPSAKEISERSANAAFIGEQSGKAVVGKSSAVTTGLTDAQRQQAREWLLSQKYKQADPLLREAAEAIAKNLPGDEADVALHFLKGMKAREGLTKGLAALNSKFKPVAVYGAIIPKLGSITRNMTGGVWQKYSNPEARGTISPKNIPAFMRDWLASIDDGVERLFGKRFLTKNEFSDIDAAYKASGGDPRKALALIKDPTMRAAAEKGVFGNNFVDTEQLIAQASKTGLREAGARLWDYPGFMFKGAEQRMRYGLFKSLVNQGKSADDAARIVRDSFYDYSISSTQNRLARDIIPFFQFMAKSIPQQAKLMVEKPAIASTVANLYAQGRDEPVSPFMEGKINFPIGQDEQGNRQYLTNLGLPFESLSAIPNLSANPLQTGRDIEQNIVGASSPLLKTAYAYTAGRDPTFGSIPGSYTKVAGQDMGTVGGFVNQLFGTGLGPAVAAQQLAGQVGKFTDDRTSLADLALNQLTGARVQSVDPDRAIQQRLQSLLERDPTIGQFRQFYDKGDDVDAQQLLRDLHDARKALKDKQKAMANVN